MTKEHLTSFKILNFKRFESLEVNDIGQFNLIVGDNGVGKTSFLESLLLNDNKIKLRDQLLTALSYRNLTDSFRNADLKFYVRNFEEGSNSIVFGLEYRSGNAEEYELILNPSEIELKDKQSELFDVKDLEIKLTPQDKFELSNVNLIPYIPFYKGHDRDLVKMYSDHVQKNRLRKAQLIKALNTIAPEIENIEISLTTTNEPILVSAQKHSNVILPLAFFGDGLLKLLRFFIEIIVFNNSRLMIDEVDTGIHYSRFSEFWATLLKTAKENNVQLFMTTHNKECIDYFNQSVKELGYQDLSRGITMVENPEDRQVKAFTYTFDQLNHAVEVGNEMRGGY